jgi:hypothetical protein
MPTNIRRSSTAQQDNSSSRLTAICDRCGKPVESKGFVGVDFSTAANRRDLHEHWKRMVKDAGRTVPRAKQFPIAARWRVFHNRCGKWERDYFYVIEIKDALTASDLLRLCARLTRKPWLPYTDFDEFVRHAAETGTIGGASE